jgi:DNA-directed RNA polymerase subunit M/transcription elongation factor TFIIS
MTKIQELESKITKLKAKIAPLREQLELEKTKTLVKCVACKRHTQVRLLTYLQTHWYVSPSGCTGGDYWNSGEGQFVCPKCDYTNRLYTDTIREYDSEDYKAKKRKSNAPIQKILDLKRYFGKVVDTYDRD